MNTFFSTEMEEGPTQLYWRRKLGGEVVQRRPRPQNHFAEDVHVLETCFTSLTVRLDCDPPAAVPDGLVLDPADGADAEVMPLI